MKMSITPRFGRPSTDKPLCEIESIPVSSDVKKKLRTLKNEGLRVNDMVRDFFDEIIRRADGGEIDGIGPGRSA